MEKFRDSHNENWPTLGRWYTFDPSYLSPEDQNEYNKAVTFLNQYSAKLNKINDDHLQAARNNDNATQAVKQANAALAQANSKLTALKAELAKLQPSDSSASSSAAQPSDSSASSSAAQPSDSSASSSAAKPSDSSSASSNAAKPSDSSFVASRIINSTYSNSENSNVNLLSSKEKAEFPDNKLMNSQQKANRQLPQTGENDSLGLIFIGAFSALFGFGLSFRKQH